MIEGLWLAAVITIENSTGIRFIALQYMKQNECKYKG